MAGLRLDSCGMLAALLGRQGCPQKWAHLIVSELPEGQALVQAKLRQSGDGRSMVTIHRQRTKQLYKLDENWITQLSTDAQGAMEEIGLPTHTAAVVLQQLPGPTCSAEQLQAAVQHPSVTRPLLQHLLQAAGDGSGAALEHWREGNLAEALCEALRLADLPLVEAFTKPLMGEGHRMKRKRNVVCSAASEALEAAALTGAVEVLQLAGTAASGQAASPACQLLRRAYGCCAEQLAANGHLAELQLLLESSAQPLPPDQLLQGALRGTAPRSRQLAIMQLVLARCGAPAQQEPLLLEAIRTGDLAAVRLLVDSCSVLTDSNQVLLAAVNSGELALVQLLLERGLVPGAAELVAAVRLPSLATVQALLAAGGGPVASPPPAWPIYLDVPIEEAPYTCPVLATLQERLRKDRAPASVGELLLIMEALQKAGYGPAVYNDVHVAYMLNMRAGRQRVPRFDPIVDDARLDMQGSNRLLGLALQRPEWSHAEHRRFLPPFKRAVRTVLLAVHRERRRSEGGMATGRPSGSGDSGATLLEHLSALPDELLMHIVGQAAYPLSAWAPGVRARRG